ncbi:hypothetical protein [Afipia carboxidovorans]|uniref:hypothetical protein n=1 Tax=Afipia carboxidovorans TaxID=40137 RepID=UPI00308E85F6|nr:hypothetical protein CRBSH125_06030 [Afipia carboxidovorans]
MREFTLEGNIVHGSFEHNGISYPANWLDLASDDDLVAVGIGVEEIADPIPELYVPQSISDRQFFQQLAVQGIITEDDALAANAAVIPRPLLNIIDEMPVEDQFSAKMIVSGATIFERNHPMTIAIGSAYGWSAEQIDAFFIAAGLL